MKPFQQGRFEDLPERPRKPHRFFDAEGIDLELDSAPFGRMNVHVKRYGSGPPLLLVHGLMTSSYSFRYALEPLGARFTCFVPDLPGAGRSSAPDRPYSPANLAAWLVEVMDALGIRGAPAIANSMGGYLALHAALATPDAFSRLVNVHSPGVPDLRMHALRVALALPGSRALLGRLVRRDPERWVFANVHYYDESLKSLEEVREYAAPLRTDAGLMAFTRYLADTMHPGPMAELLDALSARESFPIPLLLLYAKEDPMVPPQHGHVFASRIRGAEHVVIEEASHFMHVDAVERFLPPVLEFLGR